jgi:membrane dipeptidase
VTRASVPSFVLLSAALGCQGDTPPTEAQQAHADSLVHNTLLADANILTPYRIVLDTASVWDASGWGEFDYPRAIAGGLDVAVLEMLIPNNQDGPAEVADRILNDWDAIFQLYEDRFRPLRQSSDVSGPIQDGRVGVMLAVENGIAVGRDLDGLRHLYNRGVRLLTPVHSRPNGIGDSSQSPERPWEGLSPFGEEVIVEMNRLGMIVDVSHMSDPAVEAVLALSQAPVIASHSAARRYTLGWERNLSKPLIEGIAAGGGVVHVPFGGSFLWAKIQSEEQPVWDYVEDSLGLSINSRRGREESQSFRRRSGIGYATPAHVADQIDYIVDRVGFEHVGFGSGFDGSGDSMPHGLKDVSQYSGLVAELIRRGYSDTELTAMMGGNFMRVWREVERVAAEG